MQRSKRYDEQNERNLIKLWELLRCMVCEMDGNPQRRASRPDIRTLVYGARQYAHDMYKNVIEKNVRPAQARMGGGMPGLIAHIRSFLGQNQRSWKGQPMQMLEHVPFWAQLFLCFRCGELREAVRVAKEGLQRSVVCLFLIFYIYIYTYMFFVSFLPVLSLSFFLISTLSGFRFFMCLCVLFMVSGGVRMSVFSIFLSVYLHGCLCRFFH